MWRGSGAVHVANASVPLAPIDTTTDSELIACFQQLLARLVGCCANEAAVVAQLTALATAAVHIGDADALVLVFETAVQRSLVVPAAPTTLYGWLASVLVRS